MDATPIESLKGIGEKTGKLFRKLGIETSEELLSYYPRAYDAYKNRSAVMSAVGVGPFPSAS